MLAALLGPLYTLCCWKPRNSEQQQQALAAQQRPIVLNAVDILAGVFRGQAFQQIRQQAGDPVTRVRTAIALLRGWLAETPDVRALLAFVLLLGTAPSRRHCILPDILNISQFKLWGHIQAFFNLFNAFTGQQ